MSAAKQLKTNPKTAFSNDLYSINYCVFQLPGTSDFSPRERRYLFFLISIVKSGFTEIRAPMGVIADAVFRAQGQTSSVSTLRTALRELEAKGYLYRRKCRLGHDKEGASIVLAIERFTYWTQIQRQNITPLPTHAHLSPCQQKLPDDDRRNTSSVVNSQNSFNKRKDRSRARTCSNKSAKIQKYHPIVYTLMCVLPQTPDKSKMLNIARREISTGDSRESGVDWPYFSRLWPALDPNPGGRRETTARHEIVPLLYRAISRGVNRTQDIETTPEESPESIRAMIQASLASVSLDESNGGEPAEPAEPAIEQENSLSRDELEILVGAKKAVKHDW